MNYRTQREQYETQPKLKPFQFDVSDSLRYFLFWIRSQSLFFSLFLFMPLSAKLSTNMFNVLDLTRLF